MKKLFLIIMLFLLPLQYTWAMVASYDMHGAHDTEVHFGHHEHKVQYSHIGQHDATGNDQSDNNTQKAKVHEHFGFLHMSSGELLSHDLPIFVSAAKQFSIQYLFNHHSPPTYQPERPNWLTAV